MEERFFESFDSLTSFVLAKCDENEKRIVEGEIQYIKENGWEKYMVLLSNVVSKSEFSTMTIDRGSVTQSAIIAKSVLDECKLRGEKSKLLSYGFLNYVIYMVWIARGEMKREGIGELRKIDLALEKSMKMLGLSVKQSMLDDSVELDVYSQGVVSDEEFEICKKNVFRYEASEEDKLVLKKHLLFAINANDRI
ncbi:MAG: hypothetical protein MR687_07345 [Spirochaetales bacterium]|nr:hypothetical protein [Spirochaetales bacterium]